MLQKVLIVGAGMAALTLGYFFISDITDKDVIAANAFAREVQAEPLKAGDMVVLPETGSMSRICNAVVAPGGLAMQEKSEIYFNRAQRIMAWTAKLAGVFGFIDDDQVGNVLRTSIPFVGTASSLAIPEPNYANPQDCECAMARSLARGDRVCAVASSLIETKEVLTLEDGRIQTRPVERAVAVNLRRHVLIVAPETYARCSVQYTDVAKLTEQKLCADKGTLPFDVRLRQRWNLIDSEGFVTSEASAALIAR